MSATIIIFRNSCRLFLDYLMKIGSETEKSATLCGLFATCTAANAVDVLSAKLRKKVKSFWH